MDNYSKSLEIIGQFCNFEPSDNIANCESFWFRFKFIGNVNAVITKEVEKSVSLKYLSNFLVFKYTLDY